MKPAFNRLNRFINEFIKTLGIENPATSHSEKFISAIGVFISMAGCYSITQYWLSPESTHLFVASMAASAVLLFAVPHGALSQPWPLIMSHILSAIIGVACYQQFGNTLLSACIAVGFSVLIMYYSGCLHPPGGATAFFAVTSGADVHALGFDFVWLVIAANIACLLIVAVLYNGLFHWRRYPAHLFQSADAVKPTPSQLDISPADLTAALEHNNSFVDVTPDDLLSIYEFAYQHAQTHKAAREALELERNKMRNKKRTQRIKKLRIKSLEKKFVSKIPFRAQFIKRVK